MPTTPTTDTIVNALALLKEAEQAMHHWQSEAHEKMARRIYRAASTALGRVRRSYLKKLGMLEVK